MVVLPDRQRVRPPAAVSPRGSPGEPKTHPETHQKNRCEKVGPKGGQREAKRRQKRLQNEAGRVVLASLRPVRRGFGPKRAHVHDHTVITMLPGHQRPPGGNPFGAFLVKIRQQCCIKRHSGTRWEKGAKKYANCRQNAPKMRPKIDQNSSKILPGGSREAQEGGRQAPRGKNAPQGCPRSEYFTKID